MCDAVQVDIPPSAYEHIPLSIKSDNPLFNVGKQELSAALATAAEFEWVADWLFSNTAVPFHHTPALLPPEAFDNALALHMQHDITTPTPCRNPSPVQSHQRVNNQTFANTSNVPPQQPQHNNNNNNNTTSSSLPFPVMTDMTSGASLFPLPPPSPRIAFSASHHKRDVVSKNIDMLLVPVARADDVTVGYTFLHGLDDSVLARAPGKNSSFTPRSNTNSTTTLLPGRFCFNHSTSDFCLIALSLNSFIGVISMRYRTPTSRERAFFVIPRADYGAGKLPTRVLTMQSQVDYRVPVPESEFDFPFHPANSTATNQQNSSPPTGRDTATTVNTTTTTTTVVNTTTAAAMNISTTDDNGHVATPINADVVSSPGRSNGDFSQLQNQNNARSSLFSPLMSQPNMSIDSDLTWANQDIASKSPSSALQNVGSVLTPSTSDAFLPDVVHEYLVNYIDTDIYDHVLGDVSNGDIVPPRLPQSITPERLDTLLSRAPLTSTTSPSSHPIFASTSASASASATAAVSRDRSVSPDVPSPEFMVIDEDEYDEDEPWKISLEPDRIIADEQDTLNNVQKEAADLGQEEEAESGGADVWLTNGDRITPDGVGVPRVSGANDTSSGAFDFRGLMDALNVIESSFQGIFFGPKVHKDVMHPQTGELLSRCTGEVSAKFHRVDAHTWQLMKIWAAQSYYANSLPVSTDVQFFPTAFSSPTPMSLSILPATNMPVDPHTSSRLQPANSKPQSATLHSHPAASPSQPTSTSVPLKTPSVSTSAAGPTHTSALKSSNPIPTPTSTAPSTSTAVLTSSVTPASKSSTKSNVTSMLLAASAASSIQTQQATPIQPDAPKPTTVATSDATPTSVTTSALGLVPLSAAASASTPSPITPIAPVSSTVPTTVQSSFTPPVVPVAHLQAQPNSPDLRTDVKSPRASSSGRTRRPPAPLRRLVAAPLAPRPVPISITPQVVSGSTSLPPGSDASIAAAAAATIAAAAAVTAATPTSSAPVAARPSMSDDAIRASKLEAKRIKNRLSAAKSNQKRREQLEAQKKELALLRKRIEELKSRKQLITQENELLKKRMAQDRAPVKS